MDSTGLAVIDEKCHSLSENVFSDPESFQRLFDIGKMFASSSLVPANYLGKPMDCTIAVDMANRMDVSPIMVMQQLYIVKGRPSWSGQACMGMIKATPYFQNAKPVYTGDRGTDTWGCYVSALDTRDNTTINGPEVTIKMAKDEKWYSKLDKYGNETSKWKTMPELMLTYRAASFFAKAYIPERLMGCAVEGEADDSGRVEDKRPAIDPFLANADADILREAEETFNYDIEQ